jgi:hypothetical protein
VRRPQGELWMWAKRRRRPRTNPVNRARSDARACGRVKRSNVAVQAPSRRPSASRVREIRMHGLKGGPALSPLNNNVNARRGRIYQ